MSAAANTAKEKKEEEEVEFHYSIISAVTFSKQQMFKIKQQPGPMNGFMEVHGFNQKWERFIFHSHLSYKVKVIIDKEGPNKFQRRSAEVWKMIGDDQ